MKDYVDYKVLNLEKRLMSNDFKELYRLWTFCVEKPTNDEVNRCQRNAAHHSRAKEPTFMAFQSIFQKGQSISNVNDIKRLEVSLIVFSQYATLRFLILQTLINTYGADQKLPHAAHYYKSFLKQYDNLALQYSKYARWAIQQISKGHNCNNGRPYLYNVIEVAKSSTEVECQCDPTYNDGKCYAKGWRIETCTIRGGFMLMSIPRKITCLKDDAKLGHLQDHSVLDT